MILADMMNALLSQCQKTSFAIRRRAAFDTGEKDVTKKDVKTPPSS